MVTSLRVSLRTQSRSRCSLTTIVCANRLARLRLDTGGLKEDSDIILDHRQAIAGCNFSLRLPVTTRRCFPELASCRIVLLAGAKEMRMMMDYLAWMPRFELLRFNRWDDVIITKAPTL